MRPFRAALLIAALFLVLLAAAPVHAASPEPSADSGDTRTAGEPPGFVGSPWLAIAGVLLIGALAAGATIAYVRLTGGPGAATAPGGATGGGTTAATASPAAPSRGATVSTAGRGTAAAAVVAPVRPDEVSPSGPAIGP